MVTAMCRSWITGARPNIEARRIATAVHPVRASSARSESDSTSLGRTRAANANAYPWSGPW